MSFSLAIPQKRSSKDPYFNVGSYHRPVTTTSSEAQVWFNRGLTWAYSFNHEEACSCFAQALAHDPDCAMAYWGWAYAAGPNYNKSWAMFDKKDLDKTVPRCHDVAKTALAKGGLVTPVEKALIEALQHRYSMTTVLDDFTPPNKAYADEMREVYRRFGQKDLDVIALFGDALMNWKPRQMFDIHTGKAIPSSPVYEVRAVLEYGLAQPEVQSHPGVPHLYIHLMERSDTPEVTLAACDIIRELVPDAGHMAHMPTHIDVLVGEYRRSMLYNYKATVADDKFFAVHGGVNFYSFYRLHDYHSLIYAAMLAGQSKVALESVERMEKTITEEMLRLESPPMADWLEFFLAVRVHVLIRFGFWDELKRLPIPEDKELYCVTTVMTYYGKGIAYASTNDLKNADIQRELFRKAAPLVPESRLDFPNRIVDVLKVANAMLDGEIEYRRRNYKVAFESLREAIRHEDALMYTEPWGWMLPARHAYGALSLEQSLVEQASLAYAEDLGLVENLTRAHQHPKNVWALHGYHECLVRLERKAEAVIIKQMLTLATAEADISIASSCFCRLGQLIGESRKIRCDGTLPSCARCCRLSINCHYPIRKALGRPRKHANFASSQDNSTTNSTPPTAISITDLPQLRHPLSTQQESLTVATEDLYLRRQACACISILYLALDELRTIPRLEFPRALAPLRTSLASAADALKCQICPTRFLSAMQNAQLIGVLLLSAAECYSKILDSLHSLSDSSTKRTMGLQTLDCDGGGASTEFPSELTFVVELDELEWRHLARKALFHEIHTAAGGLQNCFMRVLSTLEERQIFWHTSSPPPDAPSTYRTACFPDRPVCLMVADEARRLIESLNFDR
ncbi:hypothetical protein H2204_011427 [Knufia peltigerae]|uniref:Zn(2)-C6 fungal-type domain-containing protein n=1 Tax=Knufia peltigerae TaxID=1002370 RepID=A0AA38XU86_9EURO|nr:hypothetical protein H2204_011427 [Knufia peltigerae]